MRYEAEKEEVASFMRRLYERNLTTLTGGNISLKSEGIMFITPSGKDKSSLKKEDILEVDIESGELLEDEGRLSIESEMHRLIYVKNREVGAVVHSHPTYACLYSSLREDIDTSIIAESWYLLGRPLKIPYELMGTKKLAEKVSDMIKGSTVALLENHGAIALGTNLVGAFDRMEVLEQSAKLTYLLRGLGGRRLSDREKLEIEGLRG